MSRANRWKSDAQANAEALVQRNTPFASENRTSAGMAYDWRKRQDPRDLRDAVRLIRLAYQDEVPTKLHEGQALADDGSPAMTPRAEAYIFGSPTWTDAGKDEPLVSFYLTPFRARLNEMERHPAESTRKHASIVRHVAIGGQSGEAAAMTEGVPSWCSRLVALEAITTFLRGLSDMAVVSGNAVA